MIGVIIGIGLGLLVGAEFIHELGRYAEEINPFNQYDDEEEREIMFFPKDKLSDMLREINEEERADDE